MRTIMSKPLARLLIFCGLLALSLLPVSAQDTNPLVLYLQQGNVISLIDTVDASVMPVAELPSTIHCARQAGQSLVIGYEQGIARLDQSTYELTLLEGADLGAIDDLIVNCPLVSPDAEWLYFRTSAGGIGALHRMRPDGTGLETLISQMGFSADDIGVLEWSYDNQSLIFFGGINDEWGYWAMQVDSKELHLLDPLTYTQLTASPSPDSQSNAYLLRNDARLLELWVNESLIYSFPDENLDAFPPVWSEDGEALLLIYWDWQALTEGGDQSSGTVTTLHVASDGSESTTLSQADYSIGQLTGISAPPSPLWSPNKDWALIPYGTLLNVNTGETLDLTSASAFLWQEDSQSLWFMQAAPESGVRHLMRFDTNTSEVVDVLALPEISDQSGNMQLLLWN